MAQILQQDIFYQKELEKLSLIEEENRYYNWYNGYTMISFPYMKMDATLVSMMKYYLKTAAVNGNVTTKHFGNLLDYDKGKLHEKTK